MSQRLEKWFYQIWFTPKYLLEHVLSWQSSLSHLGLHRRSTGSRHTRRHRNYLLARATPTWSLFISWCVMILSHWVSLDWVLWVRDTGSVTLTQRNDRGWPAERERSQGPHAAHVLSRCLAWVIDIVSIITLLCPSQYVLWIERSVSISMRNVYLCLCIVNA